jgi:hypothetical protein
MTITKRVPAAAAASVTRRVNINGHGADYDAWADSWGASWGEHWHVFLAASELGGVTRRVTATPAVNITRRVPGS